MGGECTGHMSEFRPPSNHLLSIALQQLQNEAKATASPAEEGLHQLHQIKGPMYSRKTGLRPVQLARSGLRVHHPDTTAGQFYCFYIQSAGRSKSRYDGIYFN